MTSQSESEVLPHLQYIPQIFLRFSSAGQSMQLAFICISGHVHLGLSFAIAIPLDPSSLASRRGRGQLELLLHLATVMCYQVSRTPHLLIFCPLLIQVWKIGSSSELHGLCQDPLAHINRISKPPRCMAGLYSSFCLGFRNCLHDQA